MSILGRNTAECVPCENVNYVDKSLYLEDASIVLEALNLRVLQNSLKKETEILFKVGQDDLATPEDFARQAEKLYKLARVYAQVDQIKAQVK